MALTLVARIKGDFEGASPSLIHYVSLSLLGVAFLGSAFLSFPVPARNQKFISKSLKIRITLAHIEYSVLSFH